MQSAPIYATVTGDTTHRDREMYEYLRPLPEKTGVPLVVFVYQHKDTGEIEVLSGADSPMCENYPYEYRLIATLCAQDWIKANYKP